MRSTLAFVTGMLVGILLSWASGPAFMHLAREWPDSRLVDLPAGIVSGLKSLQGGLASTVSPSAPFVLRRPVTRKLRMARSNVTLPRAAAVPPNATDSRFSAIHQVCSPAAAIAANASTGNEADPSSASGPGGIRVAEAAPETSASRADSLQAGPEASRPDIAGPDASSPEAFVPAKVSAATAGARKKKAGVEGSPVDDYARALKNYEDGRYERARELFAAFMQDYPRHKLLPNALYWTGETWYAQARYDRAMEFFTRVVQEHPRHPKSADALLKLAYSALRLGQPGQAGVYLQQLEARYPDSPASRLGRQARGRMQGCNEPKAVALARG